MLCCDGGPFVFIVLTMNTASLIILIIFIIVLTIFIIVLTIFIIVLTIFIIVMMLFEHLAPSTISAINFIMIGET